MKKLFELGFLKAKRAAQYYHPDYPFMVYGGYHNYSLADGTGKILAYGSISDIIKGIFPVG